mmetsp:Transcript_25711/g.60280  ORF Transcript_25711/g.60280 Transcript_25711/m.60280 type:complete len:289 (+) Transcript_25711:1123-1989(+)
MPLLGFLEGLDLVFGRRSVIGDHRFAIQPTFEGNAQTCHLRFEHANGIGLLQCSRQGKNRLRRQASASADVPHDHGSFLAEESVEIHVRDTGQRQNSFSRQSIRIRLLVLFSAVLSRLEPAGEARKKDGEAFVVRQRERLAHRIASLGPIEGEKRPQVRGYLSRTDLDQIREIALLVRVFGSLDVRKMLVETKTEELHEGVSQLEHGKIVLVDFHIIVAGFGIFELLSFQECVAQLVGYNEQHDSQGSLYGCCDYFVDLEIEISENRRGRDGCGVVVHFGISGGHSIR